MNIIKQGVSLPLSKSPLSSIIYLENYNFTFDVVYL